MLSWIAACLFSVLVLEAFLRVTNLPRARCEFVSVDFDGGNFEFDQHRFWRLSPTCPGLTANSQGLRGFWPTAEKQADEYRVVCVGDSCTFGTGVTCAETYGMQLAGELGRALPDKVVHCILLALPGYSTHQSRVLMEQHAAVLQPDLVVFYTGAWNDYLPAWRCTDAEWGQRLLGQGDGFRVAQVCRSLMDTIARTNDPSTLMTEFEAGAAPALRRVPLTDYVANLSSMTDLARRLQAEVVVVLPALPPSTHERFPIVAEYRDASRRLATTLGIAVCDAEPAIRRFEAELPAAMRTASQRESLMFGDWAHPSAFGHRVLARTIMQTLLANGLLPGTRATTTPDPIDTATRIQVTADGDAIDIAVSPVAGASAYALYYLDVLTDSIGCVEIGREGRIHIVIGRDAHFLSAAQAYAPGWSGMLSNLSEVRVTEAPTGPR